MPLFMKVNTISGATRAKNHAGWIKLESIDFGVQRNIAIQPGMTDDREGTTPRIGEFVITKKMDKASPRLFEESCTGTSLGKVVIQACRTSDQLEEYLEYTLSDVILSHYNINGCSPEDADELTETLRLNYTQIQMKYIPRSHDNIAESPIISGYDLTTATKL